jgi:uncharacterized protein (DUF924 family)
MSLARMAGFYRAGDTAAERGCAGAGSAHGQSPDLFDGKTRHRIDASDPFRLAALHRIEPVARAVAQWNMYNDILRFWFEEIPAAKWWAKDIEFDKLLALKYSAVHARAARCELFGWRTEPRGRLAEIIVLDQFSRNIYRGSHMSFTNDALALALAQEAVAVGADAALHPMERSFLYMPYMHSESPVIHAVAMELFRKNGIPGNLGYEIRHLRIIERFGRYPHRNAILGRQSTQDEIDFLRLPGSGF